LAAASASEEEKEKAIPSIIVLCLTNMINTTLFLTTDNVRRNW
jgi:hypothetical protein